MNYLNVLSHIICIIVEITRHKTMTQNNRVKDYFHQQHCLVYITIAVSCKYLIFWTSSGQCDNSTADAPTFDHQADR